MSHLSRRTGGNIVKLTLIYSVILASLVYLVPILRGDTLRAWDTPTHMFLASGYANDWWESIEPRWYGGYSRFTYPPLAHQLVAITFLITQNLTFAYNIVLFCFLTIAPLAAYYFSRAFTSKRNSTVSAILFSFLPSIHILVFSHGQFPGFVAFVFLMFAVANVAIYLRTGTKSAYLSGVLLIACVAATHTNTTFFLLPCILTVTVLAQVSTRQYAWKQLALRTLFLLGGASIALIVVIYPFWDWFQSYSMQTPIPHPSRSNIFSNLSIARLYFFDVYGPLLVLIPIALIFNSRRAQLLPIIVLCVFLGVLGLGGATQIPAFIFGSQWNWLTYERFSVWATAIALPAISTLIGIIQPRFSAFLVNLSLILLIISTATWLIDPDKYQLTHPSLELDPIVNYLRQHPLCSERFLAFGFGYQLPHLSTFSNASTLDGLWHTARTDPLLRDSGVGGITDALYFPNGRVFLETFLSRQQPIAAYCIFIAEESPMATDYKLIVQEQGWRQIQRLGNSMSVWMRQLQLVQEPTKPLLKQANELLYGYMWGSLPMLAFTGSLFLFFYTRLKIWTKK